MSDPLFTCLWTLSTAFVVMQAKIGFDTHIFSYILPFFYSKSFIENIPSSSVLCFENLLKEIFHLDSEVFVDYSYFFFL